MQNSKPFVSVILDANENYVPLTKVDQAVREWLTVVQYFYKGDLRSFNERCRHYLNNAEPFYGENPGILLGKYLEYGGVGEVVDAAAG